MSNLEKLKNEYLQLCEEFYRASDYMHSIGEKIRSKKRKIEELESRMYFKHNGQTYKVLYEKLDKPYRSLLLRDRRDGTFIIKIDSKLTPKEKQEELHIMLKRKKCLTYF
ncbi:MAG: hypothetical protein E6940_04270 [Clostridium septicum]|uniref:hypothetical protein n=1 Tax=Clostridium septicum TaxID=1504 RepID=UPI00258AB22F|nr:hypothetical protein [Clostridium septicum]MDU1313260.1 hypothetical protein [Clostridium septicum]